MKKFQDMYVEIIAFAGLIVHQQNKTFISIDDLFWGAFFYGIVKKNYHALWELLGIDVLQLEEFARIHNFFPQISENESHIWTFHVDDKVKEIESDITEQNHSYLDLLAAIVSRLSDEMKYSLHSVFSSAELVQKISLLKKDETYQKLGFDGFIKHLDKAMKKKQKSQSPKASHDLMENKENSSVSGSKEEKKLAVEYFGTDLTAEARNNKLDPVIGRNIELNQLIYTLLRKTKNNPLLIGEAGVGKTAVVELLAQKIVAGEVPNKLKSKRLIMLDLGSLVAGTKYRGEFEARLKSVLEEAQDPYNNIILFIDEIHTIIGAGGAEGTMDAANMLKPMLARGKIQLIGATTFNEFQKYIEKDAALKRRFQEIYVNEPTYTDAQEILRGIKPTFEEYHGVVISDDAVSAALDYSIRYMVNKFLPDKAIDLLDEASAKKSTLLDKLVSHTDYQKQEEKVSEIQKQIEAAIAQQDYFLAADLKKKEEKIKEEITKMRNSYVLPMHLRPIVEAKDVGDVLSDKLGIPADQISSSEIAKLKVLDKVLSEKVLGQDHAIAPVVSSIKRNRLSVIKRERPIGSYLFLGPSGVGKTYLSKLIASEYFSDPKALIRVDMSEYMERFNVSKLIGSAPGYVGYEEGGQLTEAVRRRPYSVVLFDEIEKASPEILNVLLQILDEGHIKDNKGRYIDFKNTIIIMTSNIGSDHFGGGLPKIGFQMDTSKEGEFEQVKQNVEDEVKDYLTPELLNRIDQIVVFKPLSKELLGDIFTDKITEFLEKWKEKKVPLPKFSKTKVKEIIDEIYDPKLGARPIERYIYDKIEPEIIDKLLEKMTA